MACRCIETGRESRRACSNFGKRAYCKNNDAHGMHMADNLFTPALQPALQPCHARTCRNTDYKCWPCRQSGSIQNNDRWSTMSTHAEEGW